MSTSSGCGHRPACWPATCLAPLHCKLHTPSLTSLTHSLLLLLLRPNATWSPGGAPNGGDPQTLALKRAQNWLGSVAVPVGVLGQKSPTAMLYATQLAFLKDQSGAVYYYNSPINNGELVAAGAGEAGQWAAPASGIAMGRESATLRLRLKPALACMAIGQCAASQTSLLPAPLTLVQAG